MGALCWGWKWKKRGWCNYFLDQQTQLMFISSFIVMMVSNCPRCQIVRDVKFSAVSKLSGFRLSSVKLSPVLNCPWCQIVCSVKLPPVSNCLQCQIVRGVKMFYNPPFQHPPTPNPQSKNIWSWLLEWIELNWIEYTQSANTFVGDIKVS